MTSQGRHSVFFCGRVSGAFVLALCRLHDRRDTGAQAAGIIALAKVRLQFVFQDAFGYRIRQRAFQAIADLQVHLVILDEHEQHRAVALFFLSDAPRFRDADGVILDGRIRLHLREDRDENLVGGLALELLQLLVEFARDGGRDNVRVVVEVSFGNRRDDFRRLRGDCAQQHEQEPE